MRAAWLLLLALPCPAQEEKQVRERPRPSRVLADRVAAWLTAGAEATDAGLDWVVDVRAKRPSRSTSLYSGTSGVVLFFLEHHAQTGSAASLRTATRAAAQLRRRVTQRPPRMMGLYTGLAGVAFTFAELSRSTGQEQHRQWVTDCLGRLDAAAVWKDEECSWGPVTDVISGSAGIGLALLRLRSFDEKRCLRLARGAGEQLLRGAERIEGKLRWQMQPGYAREMPNFSHGTAGVAYFLLRLYEVTRDERFLVAARRGADYLLSIGGTAGRIYHNDKNKTLFYLSYCHGPPGTARLFGRLAKHDDDPRYAAFAGAAAALLRESGVPGQKTPGFWNNHGQCCGTAGIADFFLARARAGAAEVDTRHLDTLLAALRKAADEEQGGGAWTLAEHRVRPQLLSTQTGYMQGAAGIGMLFLHHLAWQQGKPRRIVLPDQE